MFTDAENRGSQESRCELTNSNTNSVISEFVNGNESPNMSDIDLSEHHAHNESPIQFKKPRRYINTQVF